MHASHQANYHPEVSMSHTNRRERALAQQGMNRDMGELGTNSPRLSDKAVLSLVLIADMTPSPLRFSHVSTTTTEASVGSSGRQGPW